ncbi:hypothetical protein [uncultured Maribacter sp.]|uniref:hypothetical protein n=1 Tax=uncultured Maribacter sp. TaxID=431308 RepID=UPI0030D7EB60|tara:strand:+ start:18185 stop:19033 length:849 start_codon:yes stop_codon:yes gene_type:complete
MNNLNVSSEDPDDFFDRVLASKKNSAKDVNYKSRVNTYKPNIRRHFADYNYRFISGSLGATTSQGYVDPVKKDLLRLYRYDTPLMQKLKVEVTTSSNDRIINTCQNCTINAVNSLDHVLPKEELSEFSVHPKNLFPSCTECNGKKNKFWQDGGQLLFLNLYTDTLPNLQYLFVSVSFVDGLPGCKFTIGNPNGIDPLLYSVIETHYTRLGLLRRFEMNTNEVITNIEHQILVNKGRLPRQDIIDVIIEHNNLNRSSLGFNHWKSLLSIELTNCQPYMDTLFS